MSEAQGENRCPWPDCTRPVSPRHAGFCGAHYYAHRRKQIREGNWAGRAPKPAEPELSELARALDRKSREEYRRTHRWPSVDELARRADSRGGARAVILASWELFAVGWWAPAMVPVPKAQRLEAAKVARRRAETLGGVACEAQPVPQKTVETAQDRPSNGTENTQEPVQKSASNCADLGSGVVGSPG